MKRIYILCEGQAEERFVTDVLAPAFYEKEIFLTPVVIVTKRTVNKKYKGGISTYGKIRSELIALCGQHKNELVTTMIDYYMLPEDTPGYNNSEKELYDKIAFIEKEINRDIAEQSGRTNLICYLSVHEYEALLFSDVNKFKKIINTDDSTSVLDHLNQISAEFENPEHINTSVETAPSKRILQLLPRYAKVADGTILAKEIGVDSMRRHCPHFNQWLEMLG